jgi:release factor glutamine methyltransferase
VDSLIEFHLMDIFEPIDQLLRKRFDIVVSNPPYVARDEWNELQEEIRGHEPPGAVTDGNDGLEFYRRLDEITPYLLNDRGSIFVEVGYGQASTVRQLMELSGYYDLVVTRDLDGIPRVVAGRSRARGRNLTMTN